MTAELYEHLNEALGEEEHVPWTIRDLWLSGVFWFLLVVALLSVDAFLPSSPGGEILLDVVGEASILLPVWFFSVRKYDV